MLNLLINYAISGQIILNYQVMLPTYHLFKGIVNPIMILNIDNEYYHYFTCLLKPNVFL